MDNLNKKLAIASSKQIQIYELLIKIQNVINTESLLPQFIYFAKSMEEMRKKWLQAEYTIKELENKLTMEKSIYQRKINELKIDIEIHHEKRLTAEQKAERLQNELEKLQRQFEMFQEILCGDRKHSVYNITNCDDRNLISAYQFNEYNNPNPNLENHTNQIFNDHTTPRRSMRGIEDTGSIISDYTEDDIDLPNDENIITETYQIPNQSNQVETTESKSSQIFNNFSKSNSNSNFKPQQFSLSSQPTSLSLQNSDSTKSKETRRSTERKHNKHRQSTSLTRNPEINKNDIPSQRSRTKSIDLSSKDQKLSINENSLDSKKKNSITAITTLNFENGRPVSVTSELQHKNAEKKRNLPPRVKNRKKRPSREFLQRTADESEINEESEIFWNISEVVIDESTSEKSASSRHNINVMTPIVELPTPSKNTKSTHKKTSATPIHKNSNSSSKPAGMIPLAKKYKRAHVFKAQVILNSENCAACDKKTKFGKMIMKCRDCDIIVHTDCKDLLQRACFPCLNFPSQGCISDFVNNDEQPKVPSILQLFINEIETRGLISHEVGLYRVNGSDLQVKQIKEKFFKRHQVPDIRKVNEVHVLCSFVKDFLNNLNEHLITYDSWHRFSKVCEIQNEQDRILELQQAIQDLPEANRDTLAYLILHLQRISETIECKMPSSNLARVFGPSIVGNSSPNKSPAEIINELKIQHQVVENLIKLSSSFYFGILDSNAEQTQKLFKTSSKTPELIRKSKTAVVLSSILGPATNLPASYTIQSNKGSAK
ncbi:unnamed protein product [Brachionus calyciflorus]|uniref:Rac GTPase-activating protein 1 n=1 Tax=Brachionus calyciflorus TaxID=104777 RepID=A0A813M0C2_9BILA|nr:unnamed protein product [Brachionus calyciflorus]